MAAIPIAQPRILSEGLGAVSVQKSPLPEKLAAAWNAGNLVFRSGTGASAVLERCLAAAVLVYGLAAASTKQLAAAVNGSYDPGPPTTLFAPKSVGGNLLPVHYPFDLRDRFLEINITNESASGAAIGAGTGAAWDGTGTNGVALAPGFFGELLLITSGTYAGYHTFNVGPTIPASATQAATHLLEVVRLAAGMGTADNNPRIIVKVIPTKIQG